MTRNAGHDDTIYEPSPHDTRDDLDMELFGGWAGKKVTMINERESLPCKLL